MISCFGCNGQHEGPHYDGPYACVICGELIVKAQQDGTDYGYPYGTEYDYPPPPLYPNGRWVLHTHGPFGLLPKLLA